MTIGNFQPSVGDISIEGTTLPSVQPERTHQELTAPVCTQPDPAPTLEELCSCTTTAWAPGAAEQQVAP